MAWGRGAMELERRRSLEAADRTSEYGMADEQEIAEIVARELDIRKGQDGFYWALPAWFLKRVHEVLNAKW